MLRKINFVTDNYYHVYNRGTDKRKIFLEEKDYTRFLILLFLCNNSRPLDIKRVFRKGLSLTNLCNLKRENILVDIGAYCLMPNHFHLLIKEKIKNGISNFIKKLCTAYAMYFNKKNERTGGLFEGRFKAELIDTDNYLKYLFAYIHLNPVKLIKPDWKENGIGDEERVIQFLDNYQWSSYAFFTGKKTEDPILNTKEFPNYFDNFNKFQSFINDWLNFQAK